MSDRRLSGRLATAIEELDTRQRKAVLHENSAVVIAGPGSGKTKTLVAKVGILLEADVPHSRGVSCITYTNHAAFEVSRRLARLGVHPGARLASATVHSWCLNHVLRRYRSLHEISLADPLVICSDGRAETIAEQCLIASGARFARVEWEMPTFTSIRRALAAGEDTSRFEAEKVTAAIDYESRLDREGLIDYEAMTGRALRAILETPNLADLIVARFPWLVVDEYQDLGPVLHKIVMTLHETAAAKVFCVGDPDQSVMGFTGADPRYLLSLESRPEILPVRLQRNYRSGSAILAAAELALGERRGYEAAGENADGAVIEQIEVRGGLDDHARAAVEKLQESVSSGVPAHEIAVLYPGRGQLFSELVAELTTAGIPFVNERDDQLPTGPIVDFVRACAARAVAGPLPGGGSLASNEAQTLSQLALKYAELRHQANLAVLPRFRMLENLVMAIDGGDDDRNPMFVEWIDRVDQHLVLSELGDRSEDQRDEGALVKLRDFAERGSLSLSDLASGTIRDKVILTTYHSSKGREFDLVVLPGLVEGVVPRLRWDRQRRQWLEPAEKMIIEARRTFYVGLTRARAGVILIYGPGYFNNGGFWTSFGPSRFIREILS